MGVGLLCPQVVHFFFKFIFGCTGSFCCTGFSSGCGEWVLLSSCDVQASRCRGFSCLPLGSQTSGVAAFRLSSCDVSSLAARHMGSSQTRDQTRVSCISRQNSLPPSHQGSPGLCILTRTPQKWCCALLSTSYQAAHEANKLVLVDSDHPSQVGSAGFSTVKLFFSPLS